MSSCPQVCVGTSSCVFMVERQKTTLSTLVPSNLYFETVSFSLVQTLLHRLDHGANSRDPFTYLPRLQE